MHGRTLGLHAPAFQRLRNAIGGDLRDAWRALRGKPGFTVLSIAVLGVGIGLATTIFGVVRGVLLRPLPVLHQEQLVVLTGRARDGRYPHIPFTLAHARQYVASTRTLSAVAYFEAHGVMTEPVRVSGTGDRVWNVSQAYVSGRYFDVLGVRALVGRVLRDADDVLGAPPVALISYGAWQRQFGGDSAALGQRITMLRGTQSYVIVGVLPPAFDIPLGADCWVPLTPFFKEPGADTAYASIDLIGRMAQGNTESQVRAELRVMLDREGAASIMPRAPVTTPLLEQLVGNVRTPLFVFSAAAALLLLMSCANVANLLLVRGLGRAADIALRSALGASPRRIISRLLTERVLLAAMGALAGVGLALVSVKLLVAFAPADLPRLSNIRVDVVTVITAIGISALSVVVFGVAPAVASMRSSSWQLLRAGALQVSFSRRIRRATELLVVVQVALALLVLSGAGLLVRTLDNLEHVSLGMQTSHLLVAELALPPDIATDAKRYLPTLQQITERVAQLPGVRAVSPVFNQPMDGHGVDGLLSAEGDAPARARAHQYQSLQGVTGGFFDAFGIPIIAGRALDERDHAGAPRVVLVSLEAAREYWPGLSALNVVGKRLHVVDDTIWSTVVGVVPDIRYRELQRIRGTVYSPLMQNALDMPPSYLAVRTVGDPSSASIAVSHAVREVDRSIAVTRTATFDELLEKPLATPRLYALLLLIFAATAVLLAAAGLYGILAALVRLRARELAVRRALGATNARVRWSVLHRGLALTSGGCIIGLTMALAANRVLASTLFGVSPSDVITLSAATAVIICVSTLASIVPMLMSARGDPVSVLRDG